ncbi:unnamed protein product [Meloidogyne enterolobii]|uniref:Uncharacterized protein n=1 Tax=Meloidogyne enterolobii TaxID=390850 RepID=A0ACB0ZNR0_MELEN
MLEMPDYQAHDPRKIVIWCLANLLRGGMNDIELDVKCRPTSLFTSCDSIPLRYRRNSL